jgi:hypothetical protein
MRLRDVYDAEARYEISKWLIDNKLTIDRETIMTALVNRWCHDDKSINLKDLKKMLSYDNNLMEFIVERDKSLGSKLINVYRQPLEFAIHLASTKFLKRVKGGLVADSESAIKTMRERLIEAKKNKPESSQQLRWQTSINMLSRIGEEDLIPLEGIVFKYGGQTYKLTGLFKYVNQLLGLQTY